MVDEIPSQLSKELTTEMKEVVDECTEEIFNKWIDGEIMHGSFDIRNNILKLSKRKILLNIKSMFMTEQLLNIMVKQYY